jgi:hypothetical protein
MEHSALRRAAVRATLAPSVLNTQPWQLVISSGGLEIWPDWSRRLRASDPLGRQLIISCGCALLNARVSLEAAGYETLVQRFPDPDRPELLARLTIRAGAEPSPLGGLDPAIELRRSNSRPFFTETLSGPVLKQLTEAAGAEGVQLLPIRARESRWTVLEGRRQAASWWNSDPARRAELLAWTREDPAGNDGPFADPVFADPSPAGTGTGLEAEAGGVARAGTGAGAVAGGVARAGTGAGAVAGGVARPGTGAGALAGGVARAGALAGGVADSAAEAGSDLASGLLLFLTRQGSRLSWLRAGEALERVLLTATWCGVGASWSTWVTEAPPTRTALSELPGARGCPQVLLRVGAAPVKPAPGCRRLVDMVSEKPARNDHLWA